MKRKIIACILPIIIISSCSQADSGDYYNINSVKLTNLEADNTFVTDNVFIPFELHMYKKWMVGITSIEKYSKYPVIFYDTASFRTDFTLGLFGRGPGEYTGVNSYYFEKADEGFSLFTNYYFEEYFALPLLEEKVPDYRRRLFPEIVNNLHKLNDTLYLFINPSLQDSIFIMYDVKNQCEVKRFGQLPETGVAIEGDDHLQNLYSRFVSMSSDKRSIAVIFVNIPVIQIYRDNILQTEIRVSRELNCSSHDDLFDRKCKIYYSQPFATKDHIWMKYVNALPGTNSEVTELHSWTWDGRLTGRYELNSKSIDFTVSENEHSLYLFTLNSEVNQVKKYIIPK